MRTEGDAAFEVNVTAKRSARMDDGTAMRRA